MKNKFDFLVGAYKIEEIDKLLLFETERVFEHSVYGYLIMKVSEVMENKVDAILHHHTPWKQVGYPYDYHGEYGCFIGKFNEFG